MYTFKQLQNALVFHSVALKECAKNKELFNKHLLALISVKNAIVSKIENNANELGLSLYENN